MLTTKEVIAKVARLQTKYAARDQRMRDVLSVRQGDISKVYPAMFSEEYPKPLVANFVDVGMKYECVGRKKEGGVKSWCQGRRSGQLYLLLHRISSIRQRVFRRSSFSPGGLSFPSIRTGCLFCSVSGTRGQSGVGRHKT